MKLLERVKNILKIDKLEIVEKHKFPCVDCIVFPAGCSALCDKVEMDNKKLWIYF